MVTQPDLEAPPWRRPQEGVKPAIVRPIRLAPAEMLMSLI